MGGLFAKPPPVAKPVIPQVDYSAAKFDASYVEQLQKQAQAAIAQQASALQTTTGQLSSLSWRYIIIFVGIIVAIVGAILLYDLAAQRFGLPTIILTAQPSSSGGSSPSPPSSSSALNIFSARYGSGGNTVDVSSYLKSKIINGQYLDTFLVSADAFGIGQDPVPNAKNTLYVIWYVGTGGFQETNIDEGNYFPSLPTTAPVLTINSAKYGSGGTTVDVSGSIRSKITNGTTLPSFLVVPSNLGLSADPVPNQINTLYVTWYLGSGQYHQTTIQEGDTFPTLPTEGTVSAKPTPQTPSVQSTTAPRPPILSSFFSFLTGSDSSGDLLGTSHDASSSTTISGTHAPLSDQGDGAYGVQWWMFVKDWNYGFGKKKTIVKRPDTTNHAITNPHISLHPTDNTLQVSVSIFPSGEQAGKTTPAPAGHSDSTDDVFTCDVPNIPLQTWFSVGATVFGRNLDVYIDGKLVKSCLLPGVPKPAIGDIQVTPEGGFSGQICNFNHYSRMLTPGDALNFWSAGTSCQSASQNPVTKATGYAVKFGVYDSTGKEVQEYSF